MEHVQLEGFKIIGVPVKTSRKFGKVVIDVGLTWLRFELAESYYKIPNKISDNMYVVYIDREEKFDGDFTAIVCCAVSSFDEMPDGMVGREIDGGQYRKYVTHGRAIEAIASKWKEIWEEDNKNLKTHSTDFEIYKGGYPLNLGEVDVEIYVRETEQYK